MPRTETPNQSSSYRIGRNSDNYWNRTGCLFSGLSGRRVHRDDDIHIESNKLGSEGTETIKLTLCVSIFNANTLSFDPSKVLQTLSECMYLS
jgi:hypothetical protein